MLSQTILLALIWIGLFGSLSWDMILSGFFAGAAATWFFHRNEPTKNLGTLPSPLALARGTAFALWYVSQLILANLRLAREILSPRPHIRPLMVDVPVETRSDTETCLLANLITMSPGEMTIDTSDEPKSLKVHTLYGWDPVSFTRSFKNDLETRVRHIFQKK